MKSIQSLISKNVYRQIYVQVATERMNKFHSKLSNDLNDSIWVAVGISVLDSVRFNLDPL